MVAATAALCLGFTWQHAVLGREVCALIEACVPRPGRWAVFLCRCVFICCCSGSRSLLATPQLTLHFVAGPCNYVNSNGVCVTDSVNRVVDWANTSRGKQQAGGMSGTLTLAHCETGRGLKQESGKAMIGSTQPLLDTRSAMWLFLAAFTFTLGLSASWDSCKVHGTRRHARWWCHCGQLHGAKADSFAENGSETACQ